MKINIKEVEYKDFFKNKETYAKKWNYFSKIDTGNKYKWYLSGKKIDNSIETLRAEKEEKDLYDGDDYLGKITFWKWNKI